MTNSNTNQHDDDDRPYTGDNEPDADAAAEFLAAPTHVELREAARRAANTIPIFVYGSLMEGFGNHRLLERGGAELVGVAETVKRWGFISLGAFPGIVDVHGKGSTKVVGELYMVNERTRAALDSLEGHPEFYKRAAVDVDMLTSKARDVRKCETYVLPSGYDRGAERSRVPFGDWRCYVNAQEKARRDADAYAERASLVFGDGEL